MSEINKSHDAEDILTEFQQIQTTDDKNQKSSNDVNETNSIHEKNSLKTNNSDIIPHKERDVIFIGTKPIMAYVSALLTQLAIQPTVTIKARGKRITQAVDVSQMIVKRMDTVGYVISDVRISSDSLKSQDGRQRNVSNIEIDITKT